MTLLEPTVSQAHPPSDPLCLLPAPLPALALATVIDPDVAHYFLVSARCGCFKQAARRLNIKPTVLRKRLMQLEEQIHGPLFTHQGRALVLSPAGQHLQAQLLARPVEPHGPVQEQPLIRLAVAEPILHDILGRDLIALLRRNASVRLDIIAINGEQPVSAVDADVLLWLSGMDTPDPGPGFVMQPGGPLACLHYLPHIAKRYTRTMTRPECLEDLADYMLVQWQPDHHIEALQPWNSLVENRSSAVVHVHDYSLMLEMIRCGACIGLLPRYMSSFDRGLIALPGLLPDSLQRRAWMAVKAESRYRQEIEGLLEMIVNTFEGRKAWFDSAS